MRALPRLLLNRALPGLLLRPPHPLFLVPPVLCRQRRFPFRPSKRRQCSTARRRKVNASFESIGSPGLIAPRLRRRLATMLYEGVILFGIVFIAGYLFSTLTQQRNVLTHHNLLMTWIGFVLAVYFVCFWTHGRATPPMKTSRLTVVDGPEASGSNVGDV